MSSQKESRLETAEELSTRDIKNDLYLVGCIVPPAIDVAGVPVPFCCCHNGSPLCLPDVAAVFIYFVIGIMF